MEPRLPCPWEDGGALSRPKSAEPTRPPGGGAAWLRAGPEGSRVGGQAGGADAPPNPAGSLEQRPARDERGGPSSWGDGPSRR